MKKKIIKKNTISFISTGYEGEHNYIQISKTKKSLKENIIYLKKKFYLLSTKFVRKKNIP